MTVNEFLFNFGVTFFQIAFLVVLFSYNGIRCKFLEDTQYKVNNTVVNYKGRQVKIEIKEKRLKTNEFGFEDVFGSAAILYIYYINDKPAMCMYKLQRDGYANRYIAFNSNYDCSEIFKILKAGRKQFQKKFLEKCNNNKQKLH